MEASYYLSPESEGEYKTSIFERLMPFLDDWQLAQLKIEQLKKNGGRGKIALNEIRKRMECAMRQEIEGNQN